MAIMYLYPHWQDFKMTRRYGAESYWLVINIYFIEICTWKKWISVYHIYTNCNLNELLDVHIHTRPTCWHASLNFWYIILWWAVQKLTWKNRCTTKIQVKRISIVCSNCFLKFQKFIFPPAHGLDFVEQCRTWTIPCPHHFLHGKDIWCTLQPQVMRNTVIGTSNFNLAR